MVGRITSIVLPDKDGVKREPNILEKSDLLAWLQVRATTGRGGGPTQSPPHPGRVVAAALRCRAAAVPRPVSRTGELNPCAYRPTLRDVTHENGLFRRYRPGILDDKNVWRLWEGICLATASYL